MNSSLLPRCLREIAGTLSTASKLLHDGAAIPLSSHGFRGHPSSLLEFYIEKTRLLFIEIEDPWLDTLISSSFSYVVN